jgi:dimethylhistidine N-methyltransferase
MPTEALAQYSVSDFAAEVYAGLSRLDQKELPSKYLYDEVGSALFEVITVLPEYGLSRADERLLRDHAEEIVGALLPGRVAVAELGSGTGRKTRSLLEALGRHQPAVYHPIEISATALARCSKELGDVKNISVVGFEQPYIEGLLAVTAKRQSARMERLLVLFLGSTIGNFDGSGAQQFLEAVRSTLQAGDALLLGADLMKPVEQLIPAYKDPIGVTAAFNLNLLARINRDLGADFDLTKFRHEARFNESHRRIEMHLLSVCDQTVAISGAGAVISFSQGETIWTESSYKYKREEVIDLGRRSGFRAKAQWIDEEWSFAETLLIAD